MILTNEELLLFHRCVGIGNVSAADVVIFGNEFGTASSPGGTKASVSKFMDVFAKKLFSIGEGFNLLDISSPVSSTFLQFISRLMLALKHNEERFFDDLTIQGRQVLNDYIMNHLYKDNSAIINLKPLLQATEDAWEYDNIDKIEYHNKYNFKTRSHMSDSLRDMRLRILTKAFSLIPKESLILASGGKENKKAFFQTIYPTIRFHETKLSDSYKIYHSDNIEKKIILSNYFDNRTIGLSNLKLLFRFILEFRQSKTQSPKHTSARLF